MRFLENFLALHWQAHFPGQGCFVDNAPRTSPLLSLPAEIRNMIYSLTLVQPSPIMVYAKRTATGLRFFPDSPALTAASHGLQHEAGPMYHALNTFYFHESMFPTSSRREPLASTAASTRPRGPPEKPHANPLAGFIFSHGGKLKATRCLIARHRSNIAAGDRSMTYRCGFTAALSDTGDVVLTKVVATAPNGAPICCCVLSSLATKWSGSVEGPAGRLMGFLGVYAELLAAREIEYERTYLHTGAHNRCAGCGHLRAA
ncbi:hypothetical protein LTR85_003399 [Meristemomyces frigidus]|nr:hypothetical protein LTR85_003399 [Meristemomyces frigidus]